MILRSVKRNCVLGLSFLGMISLGYENVLTTPLNVAVAGLKWHAPDRAISSHSFAIAVFLPCSM